mgnify:CR=1 FL=1
MRVDGPDGFVLDGASSMAMISRDPLDLVAQAIGAESPVSRRPRALLSARCSRRPRTGTRPGEGFTHVVGDIVTVTTPHARRARQPRRYADGVALDVWCRVALMTNLAKRGLP